MSHSDALGQPRFRRGSGLAGIALCAAFAAGCARESGAPRTSLILFPPQPVVQVGGNIQLRADPSRGPLQWRSSDTTIAVVTQGLAQGIASGSALISASDGTDTGSVAITVTPANSIPSLSTDIQPIFNNYCVSCHEPPSPQENILLTDGTTSFTNLVSKPSPSIPLKTLVVPFDTADSYLYDMIRGRALNSDDNMPQGCTSSGLSPCLPPSLVQLIANWILMGAKP